MCSMCEFKDVILEIKFDLAATAQKRYDDLVSNAEPIHQRITHLLEDGFIARKVKSNDDLNYNEELKKLVEQNNQMRQDIEKKNEEITKLKTNYESYKNDQELLNHEIKDRFEAFLMAKKYYKKFLNMYFTIESKSSEKQTIYVQFFTEVKKESEMYSIRLLRNTTNGSYQLLSVNPELNNFKSLQQHLQEFNNVANILCTVRKAFEVLQGTKPMKKLYLNPTKLNGMTN